jgi:hypothetical protein
MESKWIVCVQCDSEFEFDTEDQIRYAEKGYDDPQRCPDCRRHKSKIIYLNRQRESKFKRKLYRNKRERDDWEEEQCRK